MREVGFDVTELTNVTLRQFARAIDTFATSLRPDDVALFYYAGHGLQVDGENYLIPIDFEAVDAADVKYDAYSASRVHDKLAAAKVKLLILDACRDNPFAGTRSGTRGLAPMDAQGSLIVFATGSGQTASDNPRGQNGLFTEHLLRSLREPGLYVSDIFRQVRLSVHGATGGKQSPWVFDNLIGDMVLRGGGSAPVAAPSANPSADAATLMLRAELELWDSIKTSQTPAVFEDYIRQYPKGRFSAAARDRIRALTATASASPAADCTAFYGTYNMTLRLSSGVASCGREYGPRWTLSGNADCSNSRVFETGSNITFVGTISPDGNFKATGSGATIQGSSTGQQITGTDTNSGCTFTASGQ